MYIRKLILELSLDVEHYLKVRLICDLSDNPNEDGYNIVKLFFQSYPNTVWTFRIKQINTHFVPIQRKSI